MVSWREVPLMVSAGVYVFCLIYIYIYDILLCVCLFFGGGVGRFVPDFLFVFDYLSWGEILWWLFVGAFCLLFF